MANKIYICKKIDDKKIYLYIKIDDITPQQMEAELEEIVILDEPSIAETIYLTGRTSLLLYILNTISLSRF